MISKYTKYCDVHFTAMKESSWETSTFPTLTGVESESHRMLKFIDDNFISQLVTEPTSENSILVLVIASQDFLINNVTVGEHRGLCDHKVVRTETNTTLM